MARIRTVKPEFWKSESIASLPFRTRLTFIGLWTYVDDNGVGLDNHKLVSAELFGLEDDPREARANVREDLARLHAAGRIVRYTVAGKRYLAIVNWDEHQKIDKPGKPRHPGLDDPSVVLLSREDAWTMDGTGVPQIPSSRESRETLAPGTGNRGSGNRDQGTGDSAKADTADAVSVAQGALPGMPANAPAVIDVNVQIQTISGAFIDGAADAGLDRPSGALIGRVGNRARKLLSEGKDFPKLVEAARALGASEYSDLDTAYRKRDAASKGVSRDQQHRRNGLDRDGIRSPADQRVADNQDLYEKYRRLEQQGAQT